LLSLIGTSCIAVPPSGRRLTTTGRIRLLAVPDDASGSAALLATGARQHDGTVSSLWPAAGAIAASLAEGADRP